MPRYVCGVRAVRLVFRVGLTPITSRLAPGRVLSGLGRFFGGALEHESLATDGSSIGS